MREMLLSFKPEIFELIRTGKKIYEYRHQFPNEPIRAYMYVSLPVQEIVGYIELGPRIDLMHWKERYYGNQTVRDRIDEYLARNNKYVMPIESFHMTKSLQLCDIKCNVSKFIIPQSYYYLSSFPELKQYIHNNAIDTGEIQKNVFDPDDVKNICVRNYE